MEEFINELNKDMEEILNSIKHFTSKSKQCQLIQDYYTLQEIYEKIGEKDKAKDCNSKKIKKEIFFNYINRKFAPLFWKDLQKNKKIYLDLIISLLDLFDSYNEPTIHESMFKSEINVNESFNMALKFLKNYDLDVYNVLKELINNNRVMYIENYISRYYGLTYNINTNSKSYIIMNIDPNINSSITLVHEAGHIYDFNKNKNNSSKKKMKSYFVNSCNEIFPNYLELVYKNYLRKQEIYLDDLDMSDKKDIQILFNVINSIFKMLCSCDTNLNFEINNLKSKLSELFGKICSSYYYDIYLEDPEKARYYTNLLLENMGSYDDITILKKSGIEIDELLESFEEKFQKIYKRR